jgi:parvulin-like peptidyl-prolyl isomerase
MRKYATGWFIKAIFGLIIIVFIFWGVGGMEDKEKVVAEVGSHKITRVEYEEAYNRMVNMYRSIFKEKFDESIVRKLKLRESAMNDLVDRYLLIQKASEQGMTVTDQQFRESLESIQAFKKEGKFDKKRYLEALKASGIEPAKFEASQKADLLAAQMMTLIRDNGSVKSDAQVYDAYVKDKGKINLAYMVFDPADYTKKAEVSDKEAETLYEKEKGTHMGESRYRLKYITVAPGSPVKDDVAYMDLLKSKDIDAYGKEKGLPVTDLGMMKESEVRERLKNLKAQDWLKGLRKGDISLPVRIDVRSYIFQLVDLEPGKPLDKATVMKEIKERIAREKAKGMAKADAQEAVRKKSMTSARQTGLIPRNSVALPNIGPLPKDGAGIMTLSKRGEMYDKPLEIAEKYYVFTLQEEKAPDKEEWEKDKGTFKQYLARKNEDEFYKSFMAELRTKSKVKIDWKDIAVTESD